ncbi:uncharacterized protein N7484_000888 [Penicillium longicatenatum]|uniref:uncharacterized protein n=1 Tax=Penicillium longicatenatum TaxID=1561947 RepID=UPI0025466701|nr:uncharacterized protein N7484_000888 [Penicillium longicatenatum]KAJ5657239.1 hypothetical protein N7484_000888 [Penicillium longicatenatum]
MSLHRRSDNWIDGIRGIAAIIVVTYHVCSAFAKWLNSPAIEENGEVFIFQQPFLRIIFAGRFAVSLFFLISGYVNSFNSIKQIRNGDQSGVLSKLSRNTILRAGRLVVPTNVAILTVWLVCQLNGFRIANQVDSDWVRVVATAPDPTFRDALAGLFRNWVLFWKSGDSPYDRTYWTIPYFLKGSMLVYLTLLATTHTTPRSTKLLLICLYGYSWLNGDALMEMTTYAGMFLAQLNADYGHRATSVMPAPIPIMMILSGLFLASFPDDNHSWAPWSCVMDSVGHHIVPSGGEVSRYIDSLGTTLFVYGMFFSRSGRRLLASPFMNFLGRISFAIYLIHDTLIRTVLSWMIYQRSIFEHGLHPVNNEGQPGWFERGGYTTFAVAIPLFYLVLIFLAYLWTLYVDPICEKLILWMGKKAFGEDDGFDAGRKDTGGILKS